jgi:hypothetical protein
MAAEITAVGDPGQPDRVGPIRFGRARQTHTRYRRHLTQARTAEKQRVEKLLEDGHLKLSSVISDIHGVSGRDMLDAIAAGQRDSRTLAQLARGTMRGKIRRLGGGAGLLVLHRRARRRAGDDAGHHDHYTAQIGALTSKIEVLAEPYLRQIEQLDEIDGVGIICAQDIIAEIGVDMTVFPGAAHLVSRAKWSPQVRQSAGKRKGSNATGRGNPYLGEAASSAGRTQSFLGAKYRRPARRMPKKYGDKTCGGTNLGAEQFRASDGHKQHQRADISTPRDRYLSAASASFAMQGPRTPLREEAPLPGLSGLARPSATVTGCAGRP